MTTLAPRPTRSTHVIERAEPTTTPAERARSAARGVALAYLEIRSGRRSPACLDDNTTAVVASELRRLSRNGRPQTVGGTTVLRTRVTPSARGVDATVVVRQRQRVLVVAMRLEVRDHQWVITSLGTPEDHACVGP